MISLKNKIVTYSVLFIIGTAILATYISDAVDKFYLRKEHAYIISDGIFLGYTGKVGASRTKYVFKIKDKYYSGFTVLPLKTDGTMYFIKFYPYNPDRNEATNIIADSVDLRNLPEDGYKSMPHN